MPAKFTGSREELEAIVEGAGYSGSWTTIQSGQQFRASGGEVLNWFDTGTLQFQGPSEQSRTFESRVTAELSEDMSVASEPASTSAPQAGMGARQVFVVHGHDEQAREQLELVLYKLGLEAFVLANTAGGGRTLIEALEAHIGVQSGGATFGIVLLTPDDVGYAAREGQDAASPRARQNVVLEMGMLLAALGRPNVAILKRGHLEVPSDAQGIIYLPFNNHVREVVPKLCDRLQDAGFKLSPEAITGAAS